MRRFIRISYRDRKTLLVEWLDGCSAMRAVIHPFGPLERRALVVLKACCTGPMSWLRCWHSWLVDVGKNTHSDVLKRVILRLNIPIFVLYYFLFEKAYTLTERRLCLLTGQGRSESSQELLIQFRDCGRQLIKMTKILGRAHDV